MKMGITIPVIGATASNPQEQKKEAVSEALAPP